MTGLPPLPPREIATYVVGGVAGDDWAADYDRVGREVVAALLPLTDPEALAGGRLLDFGCGSGRILRHLIRAVPGTELHGCDIDATSVEWVQANLAPRCRAVVAPPQPPLPFADGCFDVVWAVSVFSQIHEGWADWLLELRRVLRPGGTLVASFMGAAVAPEVTGRTVADDDIGMSVHGAGRPWAAGGPMVLHGGWWLRAHYGRAFEVVEHRPAAMRGQDVLVLRRPPADVPAPSPADLIAPEPDEPRELTAALADVARLHADHAALNAAHDAYAQAYADEAQKSAALSARIAELERQAALPRGRGRRRNA
ncbi:hypothetical protein DSM112329_01273 [Paraconexibacter sp. AEG42_29]|uniref:Methyltransferase type 11 domain-containing protein n=1 Tax=Paraconexibacter sp. AEG42_29 TaxID=2997339 RepID=A0AAU7ARX2_9ACTN